MMKFLARLRGERGSLMTTLVFVLVSTFVVAGVVSMWLIRSTNDYTTEQQANVKSAISQLASQLLGRVNSDFPDEWQYLSAADLADATAELGDAPELNSQAHIGYFSLNPVTGVIIAEVVGEATTLGNVRVIAELKLTPSGAGVFRGIDDAGRPTWLYSDENLDPLALWEMAPNAVQYINSSGDYVAEAPAQAPIVAMQATATGARALIGSVYCRYGGTAEYEWQAAENSAGLSDWSGFESGQSVDFEMDEGDRVEFQARSRCVSSIGVSEPSPTSNIASYARPFTTVFAGPQVTVTEAGVVTWGLVTCTGTSQQQYRYQQRINEGNWEPWSAWGSATTFTAAMPEGSLLEAQVQARCTNAFTTGPASSTGYGSAIAPLNTVPSAPSLSLTGAVSAVFTASSCPSGTTAQLRSQFSTNDGAFSAMSGWSTNAARSITANEGSRVAVRAQQRCSSPYADGPASLVGSTVTRNVPVTSVPSQPTVTLNASGSQFSWPNATCPAGTTARYTWSHIANGGASVAGPAGLNANPGYVTVVVNQGGALQVSLAGACTGYTGVPGPMSAARVWDFTRAITTAPTTPVVTVTGNGTGNWSSSGCPTGTSLLYARSIATDGSFYGAYSAFSSATSLTNTINQGKRITYAVVALCQNALTGSTGPLSAVGESGYWIRPVSAPGATASISKSGVNWYGINWSAVSCAAGTSANYQARWYRPSNGVFDFYYNTSGTSMQHTSSVAFGGYIYWTVSARCLGTYASSGYGPGTTLRW